MTKIKRQVEEVSDSDYSSVNIGTKIQVRNWLRDTIENAQKPNLKESILRLRKQKVPKIQKQYGL